MARRNKRVTERSSEEKFANKVYTLPIPAPLESQKEVQKDIEKTSLFVPTQQFFSEKVKFVASAFSDDVLVTRNIKEVLKVIFKHGDVAKRYGENGLENDLTRQQIIIYTNCYLPEKSSLVPKNEFRNWKGKEVSWRPTLARSLYSWFRWA